MKIEFDRQADALYIYIQEKPVTKTKEVEEGVFIDFDDENRIIGLEVLDVTKRFPLSDLVNIQVENIPLEISTN